MSELSDKNYSELIKLFGAKKSQKSTFFFETQKFYKKNVKILANMTFFHSSLCILLHFFTFYKK